MGQGVTKNKSNQQFYLLCIQLKTNAEENADSGSSPVVGDPKSEMSRFSKFATYIQAELNEDEFDNGGSLTQNLILKLKDGMAIVNPAYKKTLNEEEQKQMEADEESNKKLGHIEIELEEIAQGVRNNLDSLFQRGEKFDSLSQKSEQLKSISGSLKKKAKQIRQQSEGWALWQLLNQMFGLQDSRTVVLAVGSVVALMFIM